MRRHVGALYYSGIGHQRVNLLLRQPNALTKTAAVWFCSRITSISILKRCVHSIRIPVDIYTVDLCMYLHVYPSFIHSSIQAISIAPLQVHYTAQRLFRQSTDTVSKFHAEAP